MTDEDKKVISKYFRRLGRKGGKRSKRTLTSEQSKSMLEIRERKRAERMSLAVKE